MGYEKVLSDREKVDLGSIRRVAEAGPGS